MNKTLLKRHKRQVSRARERVRVSEPDVRTPQEVRAAREASRSITGRSHAPDALYSTSPAQKRPGAASDDRAGTDLEP